MSDAVFTRFVENPNSVARLEGARFIYLDETHGVEVAELVREVLALRAVVRGFVERGAVYHDGCGIVKDAHKCRGCDSDTRWAHHDEDCPLVAGLALLPPPQRAGG